MFLRFGVVTPWFKFTNGLFSSIFAFLLTCQTHSKSDSLVFIYLCTLYLCFTLNVYFCYTMRTVLFHPFVFTNEDDNKLREAICV